MEINGVDTILGVDYEPAQEFFLPFKLVYNEEANRAGWNNVCIAIIPYCIKCREPLVWHSPPEDNKLFHCPKCERVWIKDTEWTRKDARGKAK